MLRTLNEFFAADKNMEYKKFSDFSRIQILNTSVICIYFHSYKNYENVENMEVE